MLPLWGRSDSPGQAQDGQQVSLPRHKQQQLGQQLGECSASDWENSNEVGKPQAASQRECPSEALHFKKEIRRQYLRVWALRAVPPGRAGFPLAALLWRASGASATWNPPESGAGSTWSPPESGAGSTWSPPESGAGSTWSPPESGAGSTWSPPESGAGSTWSPPESGAGSTWSPPECCMLRPANDPTDRDDATHCHIADQLPGPEGFGGADLGISLPERRQHRSRRQSY